MCRRQAYFTNTLGQCLLNGLHVTEDEDDSLGLPYLKVGLSRFSPSNQKKVCAILSHRRCAPKGEVVWKQERE